MKLTIGFSPCPNDTYIFDALIHGKVDTEGLEWEPHIADVEELNGLAFEGRLAVTKLSFFAFSQALERYTLLDSGSALGRGVGPLLIARRSLTREEIIAGPIAIPGLNTTAHFLFSLAFPEAANKIPMLFSEIEEQVSSGAVQAGLIIHENRFTYQDKGLVKLLDCGEYWESVYQLPIPLGGIAICRDLPMDIREKVNRVLRRSVQFAFDHPESSRPYVCLHAQEMSESVMQQHIDLYVNDFSLDLGVEGRAAVEKLFEVAREKGLIFQKNFPIFWNE
ncbi:MAG: 1,4-dihydroxy-6-naphthoate synthase [Saprospirales bacterium]|nr:1,4-dihydroxy-6-naphthoate synthase [Saprospirales bacterium]